MATYVLVHGGNMSTDTWNRLSGTSMYPTGRHLRVRYWDGTASYLKARGHRVFSPTLPDPSPPYAEEIQFNPATIRELTRKELVTARPAFRLDRSDNYPRVDLPLQ